MRQLCVFLTLVLVLSISSCRLENTNTFNLNVDEIKEIVGTSQMSDPVITKTFTDDETIGEITNVVNSLNLTNTNNVGELKGWQYYFVVRYSNGEEITLAFSENNILIDGVVFNTSKYNPSSFGSCFY
ncbi:MAG: hypothetical protein IKG26_09895 [Bacillus sp. (in: Bacteria)]|nr:hypothetical protein [Bacillus sp. (in: firmicutes)]